uniref:CD109 molecule n=1 Tax=Eptatretus burgeri TaxID=7764 RepID=A0A8C4QW17_EPTBU
MMRFPVVITLLGIALTSARQGVATTSEPTPLLPPSLLPPSPVIVNYLITIPQPLRPNKVLSAGVSLYGEDEGLPITLKFNLSRNDRSLFVHSVEAAVGEATTVTLPPVPSDCDFDGTYKMQVQAFTGEGGLVFENTTTLQFQKKFQMTFIQTDKATYKPGHTVKLRVISIKPNMHADHSHLDIIIQDSSENRIQQWLSEPNPIGVVSKEFILSDQPPLGDWTIQVTHLVTNGSMLPKFEVKLQVPSFIVRNDFAVVGTATAKYTYAKVVRGVANITLSSAIWNPCREGGTRKRPNPGMETLTITYNGIKFNGSVDFAFTNDEILEMMEGDEPNNFKIRVDVREDLTGIVRRAEQSIRIAHNRYQISFINSPEKFKPGFNYTGYVQVTLNDGTPLLERDRSIPMQLSVKQSNESGTLEITDETFLLHDSGIQSVQFTSLPEATNVEIKGKFGKQNIHQYLNVESRSLSGGFIHVTTNTAQAKAGIPISFTINGLNLPEKISYQVMARGNMVEFGQVSSKNFQLMPTSSWAPMAKLLLFYVRPDGEVINEVLGLSVEGVFENMVDLNWSTLQAAPAEGVDLTVSTGEAEAYVGLLVVDKSVLLLKEGNDLTNERVTTELSQFSQGRPPTFYRGVPRFWFPSSQDTESIFSEAGVAFLTNLYVHDIPFYHTRYYAVAHSAMLESAPVAMAYSHKDSPVGFTGSTHVRTLFPETWIWTDAITGPNGSVSISATVPDTITSWVASAFSLGPKLGLGIAETQQLQAFQPFFISLKLPYSVVRGESFLLMVTVFNYLSEEQKVFVTLQASDGFHLISGKDEKERKDLAKRATDKPMQRSIMVPSNDGVTIAFPLSPRRLGYIPISVKAHSTQAADAITDHILVKAEGLPRTYSKAFLIDHKEGQVTQEQLQFTFPNDVVEGSETAIISVVGDIMGPSIEGLDKLVQMPYGCGEQNMINFAPNIYVLQYFEAIKHPAANIHRKALSYMNSGYQRQLTYQHRDGSFSAFGEMDERGSTWLSAFVLKCFAQAQAHMYIDKNLMKKTLNWLQSQRTPDGDYQELGHLLDSSMLGASSGSVALTAYVVTSLMSSPKLEVEASNMLITMNYLEREFEKGIEDSRVLALVTYALILGNSSKANSALDKLNSLATHEGGKMFWKSASVEEPKWHWQPSASGVETAAYALLANFKLHRAEEGVPIMRWLGQQRNHLGGFVSTQDTVVALEAMSEFAAQMSAGRGHLDLSINTTSMSAPATFAIDQNNSLVLQKSELAVSKTSKDLTVAVETKGKGSALVQLNVLYNVDPGKKTETDDSAQNEVFNLDVSLYDGSKDKNHISVDICTSRKDKPQSGMVLLEVNMLSGFSASKDFQKPDSVKRMEVENNKVSLYFDEVVQNTTCVMIPAERINSVGNTKDATVMIYDYYQPTQRTEVTYKSTVMADQSVCDFCKSNCVGCG